MRTEGNPIKLNPILGDYKTHRIIMPVYIPSNEGYYSDAFKIYKLCLESLINSVDNDQVSISVIDNGSIPEVREFTLELHLNGKIDQYTRNMINRGKADAIIGAAKACYEPLITITDADVLFLPGWIEELEKAYENNPKAGNICPFPAPHLRYYHNSSTWFGNFLTIRRRKVVKASTLKQFASSLNRECMFSDKIHNRQYFISKRGQPYLIGAGHFVAMYRRVVFDKLPKKPFLLGLKGGLDKIEQQVDKLGYYKLSTTENWVLHMGNKLEPWMKVPEANKIMADRPIHKIKTSTRGITSLVPYWIIRVFGSSIYFVHLVLQKIRKGDLIKPIRYFYTNTNLK